MTVTFVLPGNVDDPASASGGNVYGLRMCEHLPARKMAVPGAWPQGDPVDLADALAMLPDGEIVVIDGLVACGCPELVTPATHRLRIAVLVHLPLGDQAGLDPTLATDLDTREWATLRAVPAVVATSPWSARRLIDHHDLDPSRVHVVSPGTDPAPIAPGTDGRTRLLCVAAVTRHKGQDLLVEALAAVRDLPWWCVLVGPLGREPEFVDELRGLIDRHRLGGRITLAGPRSGEALDDSYAAADLVVLPSQLETYGMVVAEALMRGIPVLAAAVGAIPDTLGWVPGGSVPGILVPHRDVAAFAEALRRWLTEPDLPNQSRAYAVHRRQELRGWAQAARELSALLTKVETTWAA
jgi:glycosyltransferase involved in cell wall biosynthesis